MKQTFCLGNYRLLNILCSSSSFILVLFGILTVFPPIPAYSPVQADSTYLLSSPVPATITMTVPSNNVTVAANPNANFVSNVITASVTTNNYTGYKLSANLSGTNTNLSHTTTGASDTVPSITANYVASSFPTNYWGISVDNTNYSPAPSSAGTAFVIKNHTAAISNQSSSLYIGAKVSNNQTSGTYTNNIVLTSLVNPADYKITYNKNTTDTVSNLPDIKQGQVTANANTLSTNTPTRTGYTFLGWSESSSATTASWSAGSTFYLDATKNNANINLYAVWQINTYTVTFNVNEAGYGTVSRSTQTANYGSAVSTSGATATVAGTNTTATAASQTAQYDYAFSSWTNNCGGSVTGNCTITANFTRSERSYTITINSNNTNYGTVSPTSLSKTYGTSIPTSGGTSTSITIGGSTVTATAKSGYELTNWTHNCGATLTGACTITANFVSTKTYMQDFSCSSLASGATTTLYDSRDGSNESYLVGKLADGKCWMLDDLRLGGGSAISLTPSNTNISSNWTLPASSRTWTSNPFTIAYINSDYKNTVADAKWGSGSGKIGVYYNYCAATAGTICTNIASSNATYDICPKGWRIPTGGPSGEYQALYAAYSNNATNFRNAFAANLTGYFYSTYVDWQDLSGYFWASTHGSIDDFSYSLDVGKSSINTASQSMRSGGITVRCVAQ